MDRLVIIVLDASPSHLYSACSDLSLSPCSSHMPLLLSSPPPNIAFAADPGDAGGGKCWTRLQGILKDGTHVAIKSLSVESKQGTDEFLKEINMVSNVRHPNLVQLIGCCVEGNNRMLVYEYEVENMKRWSSLLGVSSFYE